MRLVDAYGGSGSGTLIDGNGNILTNYHVIEGFSSVQVYLSDRYVGAASVVGYHDLLDLAIVQINAGRSSLTPIPISRLEPMSGDEIITIGYPLGMSGESTVTVGVVSAFRNVDGQRYLQTDAAINPGNSGGAALDRHGNLVGVPTWMYNVENIGFLIPLREMANTIEQLKRGSRTVALPPTPTPRPTPTPTPTRTPVPKVSGGATWYIPEILATVEELKFYEGGNNGAAYENRQYLRFIDGSNARFIFFEIELLYPYQYASVSFDIEWVYYRNGVRVGGAVSGFSTFQGYTGSVNGDGWGTSIRGQFFDPGNYVAELYSDGVLVATGEFGIY